MDRSKAGAAGPARRCRRKRAVARTARHVVSGGSDGSSEGGTYSVGHGTVRGDQARSRYDGGSRPGTGGGGTTDADGPVDRGGGAGSIGADANLLTILAGRVWDGTGKCDNGKSFGTLDHASRQNHFIDHLGRHRSL